MRFLMASFHLCGRRAEHTVQLAVLEIIPLVLDCLGTQIYKLSIGFFWWLNEPVNHVQISVQITPHSLRRRIWCENDPTELATGARWMDGWEDSGRRRASPSSPPHR